MDFQARHHNRLHMPDRQVLVCWDDETDANTST